MNKTKQIIFAVAAVLIIGAAYYFFDKKGGKEIDNELKISQQETIQEQNKEESKEDIGTKTEEPQKSEEIKPETKSDQKPAAPQSAVQSQSVTFIGKIYSTPKDSGELSKFDDYIMTDSGEKYGLQASMAFGAESPLIKIINDVIVSYRDSGRLAQIKGNLVEQTNDVSGRQIQVEEIREATN